MKKETRLNRLLKTIAECEWDEENFDYLYRKLKDEYKRECAIDENSVFANQLSQTITKEAHDYIVARKNAPDERHVEFYNRFISNFISDIRVFGLKQKGLV